MKYILRKNSLGATCWYTQHNWTPIKEDAQHFASADDAYRMAQGLDIVDAVVDAVEE
jgi:hypothetical protein